MGVVLTPILNREQTSLEALRGRSFAVDASIELHRFLALVRKPDGTLFTDKSGRITSHLIGLLSWASKLITEYRMSTVFVFDGPPNPLKRRTLDERRIARKKAEDEYSRAVAIGDYSQAWSKAVMTGRVTRDVLDDAKRLLSLMGIPWLEAPEDAEAQASYMAEKGDVWAAASKDYDSLLYGTPVLARYLSISGQEFLPAQHRMRRLIPELVRLAENLRDLGINRQQLVDLAILVGTDFNEGVGGVGPKRALALIKKHGSLQELPSEVKSQLPSDLEEIRQVFLHPKVISSYQLKAPTPRADALIRFLTEERDFSSQRVTHVAEKLVRTYESRDAGLTKWLN